EFIVLVATAGLIGWLFLDQRGEVLKPGGAGPQPDLCHRPAVADRRARLKYHRTREALEQQTATAEGAAGHRPSRNAALSDGESWVACRPGYFLPVTVLSQMPPSSSWLPS